MGPLGLRWIRDQEMLLNVGILVIRAGSLGVTGMRDARSIPGECTQACPFSLQRTATDAAR